MNLTGISSTDPVLGGASTAPSSQLDKTAFLKLLVTQMQSQDPLSPSDSTQYVSQLAQFSSLEQMQNLNDNIVGLAVLQQSNAGLQQMTDASALMGKDVQFTDPTSQAATWGKVESIKIKDGVAMLTIGGKDIPLSAITQIGTPPVTPPVTPAP